MQCCFWKHPTTRGGPSMPLYQLSCKDKSTLELPTIIDDVLKVVLTTYPVPTERSCERPKSSGTHSFWRRGDGVSSHQPVILFNYRTMSHHFQRGTPRHIVLKNSSRLCVAALGLWLWDCACRSPPTRHTKRSKGGRKSVDMLGWDCLALLERSSNLPIPDTH